MRSQKKQDFPKKFSNFLYMMGIVLIGALFIFSNFSEEDCASLTQKTVSGDSMRPLLQEGDEVFLDKDYYAQNEVQRGDLVAYRFSGAEHLLIKKVMATEKDSLEIRNQQLWINGSPMRNSEEKEYLFSAKEVHLLQLYISNGHLPSGGLFLFGDNTRESRDSRSFGAISPNDLEGRFFLKPPKWCQKTLDTEKF